MMLLCYLWITSTTIVHFSRGQNLPIFYPEHISKILEHPEQHVKNPNDQGPSLSESSDLFDHLVPKPEQKPSYHFPSKNDSKENVYIMEKGENENLSKRTEDDKLKINGKTENGTIVSSSDLITKPENTKQSTDESKGKTKTAGIKTVIPKTDDVLAHSPPPRIFPKEKAINISDPVHGQILSPPQNRFPMNSSATSKGDKEISPIPSPVLPSLHEPRKSSKLSSNSTVVSNNVTVNNNGPLEAYDMNNGTKYNGECDVDDDKHVGNKSSTKNCLPKVNATVIHKTEIPESVTVAGQHPDVEILHAHFNESGPHLVPKEEGEKQFNINNNQPQTVHINSNKVFDKIVAPTIHESQEHLSMSQITRNGLTIFIVSLASLSVLGYFGLVMWRRIKLRRSGREILINEEEFCEESTDSHEFEMNQPQNRNIII